MKHEDFQKLMVENDLFGYPVSQKNAYHTIFIYEKNAYRTLLYNFIEEK